MNLNFQCKNLSLIIAIHLHYCHYKYEDSYSPEIKNINQTRTSHTHMHQISRVTGTT